jgi:hypothetical protein
MRTKWTCHVTVWVCPTFQTDCSVGEVIGGAKTVRLSKGAARITEKSMKRHRIVRRDMMDDALNQTTVRDRTEGHPRLLFRTSA